MRKKLLYLLTLAMLKREILGGRKGGKREFKNYLETLRASEVVSLAEYRKKKKTAREPVKFKGV